MAISVLIIELIAWRLRKNARFEGVALAMCRQSSDGTPPPIARASSRAATPRSGISLRSLFRM